jgi:putative flippase GtrA
MHLLKQIHSRFLALDERLRFLLVGGYNTGLTYLIFCALYVIMPNAHYLVIVTLTYLLAILNSFLMLRLLVFKSHRPFWIELWRCTLTYAAVLALNALLLAILVDMLHIHVLSSQMISMVFIAASSYIGHKYFSFRPFS